MKRIVKNRRRSAGLHLDRRCFSGCGSTASSAASADATAESTFAASAEGGELERLRPPASGHRRRGTYRRSPTTMTAAS